MLYQKSNEGGTASNRPFLYQLVQKGIFLRFTGNVFQFFREKICENIYENNLIGKEEKP